MQKVQRSNTEISSMFDLANRMARKYGQIGNVEPEDIAQNAMLKLLNRRDEKPPTPGWMFYTVRSAAYDAGRSHVRELKYLCEPDLSQDQHIAQAVCERADERGYVHMRGNYIPARDERDPELWPRMKAMLAQIAQPRREVLVLYAEGFTYQQIADMTKANIGTVRSRLHYARKQAQSLLGDLA